MENEKRAILKAFEQRGLGTGGFIHFTDFGDAIVWESGSVANETTRVALRHLIEDGFVIEMNAGLELTQKGNDWLNSNGVAYPPGRSITRYRTAQHAIADLKVAILQTLEDGPPEGLSNAVIGRGLGIYMGHVGHEGHIPRTLLAVMESEGVVVQDAENKLWRIRRPSKE
jgi:hypothetical protein